MGPAELLHLKGGSVIRVHLIAHPLADDAHKARRLLDTDDVFEYCQAAGIGGNPDHNGRWDCYADEDKKTNDPRNTDGDNELECYPQGTGPDAP